MRPVGSTSAALLAAIDGGARTKRQAAHAAGVNYDQARTTLSNLVRSGKLDYTPRQEPHSCRPVAVYHRVDLDRDAVPRAADWWASLDEAWRAHAS